MLQYVLCAKHLRCLNVGTPLYPDQFSVSFFPANLDLLVKRFRLFKTAGSEVEVTKIILKSMTFGRFPSFISPECNLLHVLFMFVKELCVVFLKSYIKILNYFDEMDSKQTKIVTKIRTCQFIKKLVEKKSLKTKSMILGNKSIGEP